MTDTRLYVQTSKKTLAGGGCSSTATSITLNSFKHLDGTNIAMADFGTLFWMTLEPGTSREEIISVGGLTQNASGTCTLTSVTRGLKTYSAYASGGTAYAHAGGSIAIVTNNPQMYEGFANKGNDETITGLWDFSTSIPTLPASNPTTNNQAARKAYVDTMVPLTYLDTDGTLAANSDSKVATQKATKTYVDGVAVAGAPNASTTVKGIVEEATTAEVQAGTATGGTGARLFVNPSSIAETGVSTPIKTKSTGLLDSSILPPGKFSGTGADGALAISSGTTTINLGGAMFVQKNYTSISITGTGALAFSNPHANGTIIILKSQGAVTLTSSSTPMLDGRSLGATAETDGVGLITNSKTGVRGSSGGGGGGSIINNGANASVGSSTGGAAVLTVSPSSIYRNIPVAVGAGGVYNNGGGGSPGTGGGAIIIECGGAFNFTTASGISFAGAAGGSNASGGGGGGTFLCIYNTLTANSGTVTVTGGAAAANGGGFSGGGAGGNGLSLVVANNEFN